MCVVAAPRVSLAACSDAGVKRRQHELVLVSTTGVVRALSHCDSHASKLCICIGICIGICTRSRFFHIRIFATNCLRDLRHAELQGAPRQLATFAFCLPSSSFSVLPRCKCEWPGRATTGFQSRQEKLLHHTTQHVRVCCCGCRGAVSTPGMALVQRQLMLVRDGAAEAHAQGAEQLRRDVAPAACVCVAWYARCLQLCARVPDRCVRDGGSRSGSVRRHRSRAAAARAAWRAVVFAAAVDDHTAQQRSEQAQQ